VRWRTKKAPFAGKARSFLPKIMSRDSAQSPRALNGNDVNFDFEPMTP
jgi:hypothetical protein